MKHFIIDYKGYPAEVYTEANERTSEFSVHLQTGPVTVFIDTDADGAEHWKEKEYGATDTARDLGALIEKCELPFMKK